ncbi:MAG: metallophosphoesterase [Bacilli bacterium]
MRTRQEKNKKIKDETTKKKHQKRMKKIVKVISIILIISITILSYGMFIGSKYTFVNEHKITDKKIPNSFHGLKIVQISDLLYPSLKSNDLDKLTKKINELKPDILVFTGNIKRNNYELTKKDITTLNKFFNSLNSNIKKYAIYGNNDNDNLKLIFENTNFLILDNQEDIIYNGENESIKIIGFKAKKLDFSNITKSNDYTICLLSNPDKITKVSNTCQVVFSGETLGGEIKLPFTKGLDNHTYHKNYYLINQTKLYINNGLGNNYNLRLFNHPSINFYRLTNY